MDSLLQPLNLTDYENASLLCKNVVLSFGCKNNLIWSEKVNINNLTPFHSNFGLLIPLDCTHVRFIELTETGENILFIKELPRDYVSLVQNIKKRQELKSRKQPPNFSLLEALLKEFSINYEIPVYKFLASLKTDAEVPSSPHGSLELSENQFKDVYMQTLASLHNHSDVFQQIITSSLTNIVSNCRNVNKLDRVKEFIQILNALAPYYNEAIVSIWPEKYQTINSIATKLIDKRQTELTQN